MQRTLLDHALGIFRKERLQNGKPLLVGIGFCLAGYALVFALGLYLGEPASPMLYLGGALYVTLLYTWASAASVYVLEHEKNTFPFLRSLPVSPLAVAIGKISWTLCSLLLLLACCLLFTAVCCFLQEAVFQRTEPIQDLSIMLFLFVPTFIEVFLWGIFWSTRCRSASFAAFASAGCVIAVLGFIFNFAPPSLREEEIFVYVLPYRIFVIVIVAILAGWGAMRWFEFSAKDTRRVLVPRNFGFIRYPKTVQSPFLALIHQHLRHVSLVYPLGVLCFALFALGCLFVDSDNITDLYGIIGYGLIPIGIIIFWGNIFGHDQRNDSYKFLTRLGVHEGLVWWSRMIPATLFYLPVLLSVMFFFYVQGEWSEFRELLFDASLAFTAWLTLLAVGAFCSISHEKQSAGIVGTFSLCCLFFVWAAFFIASFGASPLWTTVPVAVAFLLASRLRAGYWLREITTWRSRLIPLIPVLAVVMFVFIALPFVRVYSVPYISWEEVETYLADTPVSYKEQLMQHYTEQRNHARSVFSGEILVGMTSDDYNYATYFILGLMPWEEARRERILRLRIVAALYEYDIVRDDRADAIWTFCGRLPNGMWDEVWDDAAYPEFAVP